MGTRVAHPFLTLPITANRQRADHPVFHKRAGSTRAVRARDGIDLFLYPLES